MTALKAERYTMADFWEQPEQQRTSAFFKGADGKDHPCAECGCHAINHWISPDGTVWCLMETEHKMMFKVSPPRSYGLLKGIWQWSWSCSCGEPKRWVVGDEWGVKQDASEHLATTGVAAARMVA